MLGRTHLLFGFFLATFFTNPAHWVILLFASILPDIDTTTSLLGRKTKLIGRVFEHRGFFHSLFFILPATIILGSFQTSYGVTFLIGCMSHLLLDAVTKQGIRLFPFRTKIKGPLKVGTFPEYLFASLLFILILLRIF